VTDVDLRALEREARSSGDDLTAWVRYVRALDRQGEEPPDELLETAARIRESLRSPVGRDRIADTRIAVGDEVSVDEQQTPFITGKWRGIVVRIVTQLDEHGQRYSTYRVRPILPDDDDLDAAPIAWRVRPTLEQFASGLQLAREDRIELIARGRDAP